MGAADVVLVGGVEHMGHHPMGEDVDFNPRFISERIVDESAAVMGQTAENLHDAFPHLAKEDADAFAVESQRRAAKAWDEGVMDEIVVPMSVFTDEGWTVAARDEFLRPETTMEALAELRTPFRTAGRVTAGNSAGLTDGATAALITSEEAAAELELEPKMRLVGFAYAGVEPELMGLGPVPATDKVLEQTGISLDDVGLFELNEPFAVQVLTWCDGVGVAPDDPRLNPYGGAIACGHPLAATGVRLMAQLARGFRDRPDVRYGLTALCIGLGMGAAVLWENVTERRWLTPRPQFKLQRIETRVGPVALVTMDNGEDWQKPNTFGEQRSALARRGARPPANARLARAPAHRKAVRLRRRSRHRRVRRDHPGARPRGRRGRARALRPPARSSVHHPRRDQRRSARGRRRDRAPLRLPDDLLVGTPFRLPRGLPRAHPRLGRDAARPQARRRRAGGEVHRREPAPPEPHAHGSTGVRAGIRRRHVRARRVPRRVACAAPREDRGRWRQGAARSRSLRRRRGHAQGARPARRPAARRRARALSRARPHRGRGDVVARGRLPRRGGRSRRAPSRPAGAGVRLRVQPRRAPRETWSRHSRGGAEDESGGSGSSAQASWPASSRCSPCGGSRSRSCSATSPKSRWTRRSRGSRASSTSSRGRAGWAKARRASSAHWSPAERAGRSSPARISSSRPSSRRWP